MMVTVVVTEVLELLFASPAYDTVILAVPAVVKESGRVVVFVFPLPVKATVRKSTPLFLKITLPEGLEPVIVAVNVTVCPETTEAEPLGVRVIVVLVLGTVIVTVVVAELLELLFASPA
jgi:hypothetical protein